MDIYNQQQYQDFTAEVQLILNTIQLKQLIIQTSKFKNYLQIYEEYLLKCILDYNETYYTPYIQIYFHQLQDNQSIEYKKIHFTQKQYFTIGYYGTETIKLKDLNINTIIKDVKFQINEVEIQKLFIDFMHLEVNYEDLIRKKEKNEYFYLLNKELTNFVSYQSKSKIWYFEKKRQEKLKIKSLSTKQNPALIKISENSYNLSLQKGQVYKLGDGPLFQNLIEIIEQFDTAKEYLIKYNNQQQLKEVNYLGIPNQVNMNINLLQDQDSQIKEILNTSTLVISVKFKQPKQSRKYYVLIAFEKKQFNIGSIRDNDIVIDEQYISKFQSQIIYKQNLNKWKIVDLLSDYGTWLILQKEQYYRIGQKTIIKLGSEAFQFQAILNEQDLRNKENNVFQQKQVKDQAIDNFIEEILSM